MHTLASINNPRPEEQPSPSRVLHVPCAPPLFLYLCPSIRPRAPRHRLLCLPGQLALGETASCFVCQPSGPAGVPALRAPSRTLPSFSQTVLIAPSSALTHHFIITLRTALLFRRCRDLFMCLINGPIPSSWYRVWLETRLTQAC